MSLDLAVATPSFLDLTFTGLEALPALGEERFASDLLRSPGGGAITAVGAARLGLSTALAAPLGNDVAGELVMEVLREDGVSVVERRAPNAQIAGHDPGQVESAERGHQVGDGITDGNGDPGAGLVDRRLLAPHRAQRRRRPVELGGRYLHLDEVASEP